MNTAMARRLALGDRVIWMGNDACQPNGCGTVIRITAHQVEVLWEGETAKRYRRPQLHNLRHENHIFRGGGPSLRARSRLAKRKGACDVRQRNKPSILLRWAFEQVGP
jgi:hypothetical protein